MNQCVISRGVVTIIWFFLITDFVRAISRTKRLDSVMEGVGYREKMLYPCGWCEKAFATLHI